MEKKAKLIDGHVGKMLLNLAAPMMLGILAMVGFNLADTYFVGQLGTLELAALSFTFPVILVINSIALGLGVGASAVISVSIGEGDHDRVRRITTNSIILALLIVVVIVLIGYSTIEPLFRTLGADDNVIPLIMQYMKIWYLGMGFVVIPMVGNNAIRATGDTKTPSFIMIVAVTVNIILDPLLIFGIGPFPRLELAGAAMTTVFSRMITFSVAMWILYHRDKMLTIHIGNIKQIIKCWGKILYIGIPTALSRVIIPVSAGIITRIISGYGHEAVAGFGVATRVEFFSMSPVRALAVVFAPFVGQNYGAGLFNRVKEGISKSFKFSLFWGVFIWIVLFFVARPVAALFNKNPEVIRSATLYLRIVPVAYGLQGILLVSIGALNVLKRPLQASGITIIQMIVIYIPLAIIGSKYFDLYGIFTALAIVYALGGLSGYYLKRIVEKHEVEYEKV